ncbi:MAG: nucleobase:cation symporter-2 family protein [Bacillaceae bacterium]
MMTKQLKNFSLALQHVLAMYAGAVIVPIIVGNALNFTTQQLTYLISVDIVMCGVATILQAYKNRYFGIGLPVVLGCTFTAVGPMITIGTNLGTSAIYGAIIVAGIFLFLFSGVFGKLVKYFPPVVTGSVVTIIGITLIPVAINNAAGGQGSADFGQIKNLALAFFVFVFILAVYRFGSVFMRAIAVLLGLAVGTIIAAFMGDVSFDAVREASWFHMVTPFHLGMPTFNFSAILTMIIVIIVGVIEATGVYFALGDICKKEITEKDLTRGYRAEGLAIILGGLFNAFPYTTYSQNVGLVQLSGVKSRNIIFMCGGLLVLFGFLPKLAALTTIIPESVLGGAMIVMFGMVISYGIKMLGSVDLTKQGNLLVIACSVGLGLGITVVPTLFEQFPASVRIITDSGIVLGSLTAVLLNAFFTIGEKAKVQSEDRKVS